MQVKGKSSGQDWYLGLTPAGQSKSETRNGPERGSTRVSEAPETKGAKRTDGPDGTKQAKGAKLANGTDKTKRANGTVEHGQAGKEKRIQKMSPIASQKLAALIPAKDEDQIKTKPSQGTGSAGSAASSTVSRDRITQKPRFLKETQNQWWGVLS